ncbi:MAG TPA: hypothetical protein VGV61_19450 [Thermoanaerobaculia bacterium]|jgi:hypothetical protein|nr:hypothetical protein [Thermoanaerobaculia bacterium]
MRSPIAKLASIVSLCLLAGLLACRGKETAPAPAAEAAEPEVASEATPPPEEPLAPLANPPGAISATQAFTRCQSRQGGYSLEVPAAWTCTENLTSLRALGGPDGALVVLQDAAGPPNAKQARRRYARILVQRGLAVRIEGIDRVSLPNGPAMVIHYTSNSGLDPETHQQFRRGNETYLFYKGGRVAALNLWAPQGADTKEAWARMAKSFRWS